ncbi:MAG: helix-turn-helix transcriptional regulator [Clostridia bacterium]|nr:helix-turn-helix transcriptional regulator [Clostridia bacterium]
MFINKSSDGANNVCGQVLAKRRKEMRISQRELADRLQLIGLDVDKNAVQRIESGQRFVTDIELVYLSKALELSYSELLIHGSEL